MSGLSVSFAVAGVTVRLEGLPASGDFLERHYPGFHHVDDGGDAGAPAAMVVSIAVDIARGFVVPLPPPDEPPIVRAEPVAADRLVTTSHWHEGELDFARGRGTVTLTNLDEAPFRVSLENLLRVTFAGLLVRRHACLLHAAGLVREGRAFVFFGLSGSGKSSTVAMSPDLPSLSDDMIALIVDDGRLFAERVPFWGQWPSTARHAGRLPVARLLRLVPAPQHELRVLPRILQATHLRACMPFLAAGDARALDVVEAILRVRPVEELRFAMDPGFWELLR